MRAPAGAGTAAPAGTSREGGEPTPVSEYCTTVRRNVPSEPIPGTDYRRCPACGLEYDPRPPPIPRRNRRK
mgnify:CR=1 FL=1